MLDIVDSPDAGLQEALRRVADFQDAADHPWVASTQFSKVLATRKEKLGSRRPDVAQAFYHIGLCVVGE